MKSISTKTLRDATWRQVYMYQGLTTQFHTFACDALPGLTITHERRLAGRKPVGKVKTTYTITRITEPSACDGGGVVTRKTDSPTQAVRIYNEQAHAQATGDRRPPPGSPKQVGRLLQQRNHV